MQRDISDPWLRGLKPPDAGRLEVWDSRIRGLALRVTSKGVASWSVRARTKDGKRTRPTLGTWPAVGVGEARKRALATLVEIQRGSDPVAESRAARAARRTRLAAPTVEARLKEWRDAKEARWSARYSAEVARLCQVEIVPLLGRKLLVETTRAQWVDLIRAKHRRAPGVGAMLYRTAAAFLNHAEAHGWIALPLLPRKGLAAIAPPVRSRDRVLSDPELVAVWRAAERMTPKAAAFIGLMIMTAAREGEVADIMTGEIDLAVGRWTIPGDRTKNGVGIVLPLHPLLINGLAAVWPAHGARAGHEWRLLGAIAGSGFRGFSQLKTKLDGESGVRDWRWHDLRRTARTGMARLGVPREHAEAALNHISGFSSLERVYNRHPYADEIIAALGRWQAHVAVLVRSSGAGVKP